MLKMQIANGDHVWRVEVENDWVYLQKQYTHDGDEFWETELSVAVIKENTEQVYAYLREYVSHRGLCFDLTKDVWHYAREQGSGQASGERDGETV